MGNRRCNKKSGKDLINVADFDQGCIDGLQCCKKTRTCGRITDFGELTWRQKLPSANQDLKAEVTSRSRPAENKTRRESHRFYQ